MTFSRFFPTAIPTVLIAMLGLAGCGTDKKPETPDVPDVSTVPPKGTKIGRPYVIKGVEYTPRADYGYAEEGEASWYGRKFHGRRTANGETYNMHAMTAAHKTLPMPSIVKVTNLENGRSVELRVNDRGPFIRGRIIDVSKKAAEKLGFKNQGVATVRVEVLADKSLMAQGIDPDAVKAPRSTPVPRTGTVVVTEPPAVAAAPAVASTSWAETSWIQAGAFSSYPRAETVKSRLATVGSVVISPVTWGDTELYRVRIGPVVSEDEAQQILTRVVRAGYPDSRIVVD